MACRLVRTVACQQRRRMLNTRNVPAAHVPRHHQLPHRLNSFPTRWVTTQASSTTDVEAIATADVFATDSSPVILFDGVCNFCNAGVNLVLSLDADRVFRFAALQSEVGRSLLRRCDRQPDDISSMVVVEKDAYYIRSDAALKIGERLRLPFPIFSALLWPLPKSIRDRGYDWIAENRYKLFGIREECRLTDSQAAERFLS